MTAPKKKPAAAAPKKPAAAAAAPKKPAAAPADRKPKAPTPAELKKQQQALAEYLATGIDFTPFTVDAGDGVEWAFKSDMMPSDIGSLRTAVKGLEDARSSQDIDVLQAAVDGLADAIRALIIDDAQRGEFPRPAYGINALTWFAMTLIAGRTGFPTE